MKNKEDIRKVAVHAMACPNITDIVGSSTIERIHGESEVVLLQQWFFSLFHARHIKQTDCS